MKRVAALITFVVMVIAGAAHAQEATNDVEVRNNVFAPADIRVEHGQRVTWTLVEGKHTVTSDRDGRFDSGAMASSGRTFSFAAPRADVTIFYHCRIHGIGGDGDRYGSGMVGRIVVGKGSPVAAQRSDIDVRKVPSKQWPTLEAGLRSLAPDRRYRIELAKGRYRPLDVTAARLGFKDPPGPRFDLTIRGVARRPADVVFEGAESLGMSVDGLHIENVSFRGQRFAALFVRGVDRWSVDDVVIPNAGKYGIWIEDAYHGRVRRASVTRASVAGIAVNACGECDLLVDSVTVARSLQGLSAYGAGALVVRGSVFHDNGVGIALKSAPAGAGSHRGAHVLLNTFRRNTARGFDPPPLGVEKDLPVGAGVWIGGGAFDVIESNDFDGHSFGVVITGPAHASRVEANTLSGSIEADVGWDGFGADVCFARNVGPDGRPATSMPAVAQDVYACDLPATVGIPYPLVTATVLAWGSGASGA